MPKGVVLEALAKMTAVQNSVAAKYADTTKVLIVGKIKRMIACLMKSDPPDMTHLESESDLYKLAVMRLQYFCTAEFTTKKLGVGDVTTKVYGQEAMNILFNQAQRKFKGSPDTMTMKDCDPFGRFPWLLDEDKHIFVDTMVDHIRDRAKTTTGKVWAGELTASGTVKAIGESKSSSGAKDGKLALTCTTPAKSKPKDSDGDSSSGKSKTAELRAAGLKFFKSIKR